MSCVSHSFYISQSQNFSFNFLYWGDVKYIYSVKAEREGNPTDKEDNHEKRLNSSIHPSVHPVCVFQAHRLPLVLRSHAPSQWQTSVPWRRWELRLWPWLTRQVPLCHPVLFALTPPLNDAPPPPPPHAHTQKHTIDKILANKPKIKSPYEQRHDISQIWTHLHGTCDIL